MNIVMGTLGAGLALAFTSVAVWNYRHIRNGEWHTYRHDKMRRWVNGQWQVRQARPNENDDDIFNYSI